MSTTHLPGVTVPSNRATFPRRVLRLPNRTISERFPNGPPANLREAHIPTDFPHLAQDIFTLSVQNTAQALANGTRAPSPNPDAGIWDAEFWDQSDTSSYHPSFTPRSHDSVTTGSVGSVSTIPRSPSPTYLFGLEANPNPPSTPPFRPILRSPLHLSRSVTESEPTRQFPSAVMASANDANAIKMGGMSIDSVPKLNTSEDWDEWSRSIQDYLVFNNLDGALEEPITEASSAYQKAVMRKASTAFKHTCGTSAYQVIKTLTDATQILATLITNFEPEGEGLLQDLGRRFLVLKLEDFKNVDDYANEYRRCVRDFAAQSTVLPEAFLILKFKIGLGPAFDAFCMTWEQTHKTIPKLGVKVATLDQLIVDARNAEKQVHTRTHVNESAASTSMLAKLSRPTGDSRMIEVKYCTHCHRDRHTKSDCHELHPELKAKWQKEMEKRNGGNGGKGGRRDRGNGNGRNNDKFNKKRKTDDDEDEKPDYAGLAYSPFRAVSPDFSLMAITAPAVTALSTFSFADAWILDSGCTQHTTYQKELFVSMTPVNRGPMVGISGPGPKSEAIGTIRLKCLVDGELKTVDFSNVLYTPNAKVNLLSVSQIVNKGADVQITKQGAQIKLDQLHLTANISQGLWVLRTSADPVALKATSLSPSAVDLWHSRLGHLGEQNVKKLANMSTGIDLKRDPKDKTACKNCAFGKLHACPHRAPIKRATMPLELLHGDLMGPILKVKGLSTAYNGALYVFTLLDDATQRSEVYFLRQKTAVTTMACFRNFQNSFVRGQCRTLRFRSDGGSEFLGEFKQYCEHQGIVWESTIPDNPQMNGASERLGQTLMAKAHPMMTNRNIPTRYWPEAVRTANYLRNRSPNTRLGITPYEKDHGVKPDLGHVRIWGSKGLALKHGKNSKFKEKATSCRLIGYEGDHIYRLLGNDGLIFRATTVKWLEKQPHRYSYSDSSSSDSEPEPSAKRHKAGGSEGSAAILPLPSPFASPSASLRPIRSGVSPPAHTNESLAETLAQHPELQIARSPSPDPISLLYACLSQAKQAEPYEPKTYKEAMADSYRKAAWQLGMNDEFDSLVKNDTWVLVPLPPGRKALGGKWVFKLKRGSDGEIVRHKARWVVRGFEQRAGLDFNETFASVVKPMSYKAIFAMAAALDYEIEQMDVKTAFLYGNIEEDIYIEQPTGYSINDTLVCKLKKALYGLKQSPRVWYDTLSKFLKSLDFAPLISDYSVFTNGRIIIGVYVDDILLAGPSKSEIQEVKNHLNQTFQMTDLGPVSYYLGMKVTRDRPNRVIRLSQAGYVEQVLKDHGMWDVKPVSTPMETTSRSEKAGDDYQAPTELRHRYQSAVGSLMYAMLGTRPDIAFAVSVVSRYGSNPTPAHWAAVKRIFRYLRGTATLELTYQGNLCSLTGYTDSDWAGDHDTRRSTSGYVFSIGSGAISWSSKRQSTVALSTCEAEYIGQTQATKEAMWLQGLLQQLALPGDNNPNATPHTVVIYGDNQGAIALAKNPQNHGRCKHMEIQQKFVREKVTDQAIDLIYTPTDQMVADGLTKALCRDKFEAFRTAIGLVKANS